MNEEEKSESDQTVPEIKIDDKKIIKVAIYSRIPTNGDWPPGAAEKEINCLKEKIQKKEHWELCKIYTDRGLSRKSRGCYRVELKKMLRDAKNREIDLIVCPTFARFGRNIGETEEQQKLLTDFGCDSLQGYFLSKPIPAEEVVALYKSKKK